MYISPDPGAPAWFTNRHHPGLIYVFATRPGFLMAVLCNLSVVEFDVRLLPQSKCYEIWNQKSQTVLLFAAPPVEVSEIGTESGRNVVEGK